MKKKLTPHIVAIIVFVVLGLVFTSELAAEGETESTTNKPTTSKVVFSLDYSEHNDGCLVLGGYNHFAYRSKYNRDTKRTDFFYEQKNNNAVVNAEINRFNNEIRRLHAVLDDNQYEAFNNMPVGSWYFVYLVDQKYLSAREPEIYQTYVMYYCRIWQVNVVAK
jgi:hypothetical protein